MGEEEACANMPFLFPQEACLRAPFFVFEDNYIWGPSLTVPPARSPFGGTFFFQLSTQIKATWWCLSVFQTSYEGNLCSDIPPVRSLRLLGGWRGGKGKGGGRSRPVCTLLFLTSPSKRKLQPPTNQPTNPHPTDITNQHPTWWIALRWTDQHFALFLLSLFLFFFPCLRVCSFPVGDPGCVLFSLPKRLQKKDWRTTIVYFRVSNFEKHENFQQKIHGEFWALTFRPAPFWRCCFFCDTIVVFSIQCLWERFFLTKKIMIILKHFSRFCRKTVFFKIQNLFG